MILGLPFADILPVLRIDPWARTLRDNAGENHPSVGGTGLRWSKFGQADSLIAESTGRLVAANTSALQSIADFTLFWWGDLYTPGLIRTVFDKRDAGGTQIKVGFDYSGGDRILLYDGLNTRTRAVSLSGLRSVCVTLESGSIGNVYLNGTLSGPLSGVSTITGDDAPATLLNAYDGSEPLIDRIGGTLLYADVLEADRVAALHTYGLSRFSPRVSSNRYYWDTGSIVPVSKSSYVGAWDLGIIKSNKSADRSGRSNNVTGEGGAHSRPTLIGSASFLDGVSGRFVASTIDEITKSEDFSVEVLFIPTSDTGTIFQNAPLTNDRVGMDSLGGVLRFGIYDGVAWNSKSGTLPAAGLSAYVVATWEAGTTTPRLWINGVEQVGTTDTAVGVSAQLLIGSNSFLGVSFLKADIGFVTFSDEIITEEYIAEKYSEIKRRVLFHEKWDNAWPTIVDVGAGNTIGGTLWYVQSGTWKTVEDSTGTYAECVTDGKIYYQGTNNADKWTVKIFEQKAGVPTLNRLSDRLEIDGTTGDKVGEVLLTVG
jgi:hypothetical protein